MFVDDYPVVDLEPAPAFLHVAARNPALAADDRVDLRRFALPALRLGPRVHDDDLGPRGEPLEHLRLELFYQYPAERHPGQDGWRSERDSNPRYGFKPV